MLKKSIDNGTYHEGMAILEPTESIIAEHIGKWKMNFQKWKKKEDTPWLFNLETKEWEVFQTESSPFSS